MKYVYIAGPYTQGDVAVNVRNAMGAADAVEAVGYAAYVPHLCHFRHLHYPQPYEYWMQQSLSWLAKCDALVLLPGPSAGGAREVVEAVRLGIPVLVVGEHEDEWVVRLRKVLGDG